jgi:hypothetical protein
MGRCDCGSETDWTEVDGTWICVACREEEIEKLKRELKEGLEKTEQAERSLRRLRVDTLTISDLLDKLGQEIEKIRAA